MACNLAQFNCFVIFVLLCYLYVTIFELFLNNLPKWKPNMPALLFFSIRR